MAEVAGGEVVGVVVGEVGVVVGVFWVGGGVGAVVVDQLAEFFLGGHDEKEGKEKEGLEGWSVRFVRSMKVVGGDEDWGPCLGASNRIG